MYANKFSIPAFETSFTLIFNAVFWGPDFDLLSFSGDREFQRVFAALDELNLSDLKPLFKEKRFRVIITRH